MFLPAFEGKPVRFIIENQEEQLVVTAGRKPLMQILNNLLTNAIKYTEKGYIRAGYRYEKGGLTVYVEDTGIGIPEKKKDRVFGRFEKFNEFVQGVGLGLSICKAITDAAGGRIWFESEEGKGSLFCAWIPCEKEEVSKTI